MLDKRLQVQHGERLKVERLVLRVEASRRNVVLCKESAAECINANILYMCIF